MELESKSERSRDWMGGRKKLERDKCPPVPAMLNGAALCNDRLGADLSVILESNKKARSARQARRSADGLQYW